MTKDDFIKKAKMLGYSDEQIQEIIDDHEEAKKDGVNIPYEIDLIALPKDIK